MTDAGGPSKAEKLAAAKRKLKEFESRRYFDGGSTSPSVVSSEPGNGHNGRNSCVSEDSVQVKADQPNGDESMSSRSHSAQGDAQQTAQVHVNGQNGYVGVGNEWYNAYLQLKSQHDELCNHYAQLHSAYSQVSATGVHVEAEKQIVQLQSALATMVEEKLACQSDLRRTRDELEIERLHHSQLKTQLGTVAASSSDQKSLLAKIAQQDGLLAARQLEFDTTRREAASLQASLLAVQHERSEAQARVKSLVRDNSTLEATTQRLRKDLQMKELYLTQLGAHNVAHAVPVDENALRQLHEQVEKLGKEVTELREERSRLVNDGVALRSHYSAREEEMQRKQAELITQLDEIQSLRWAAESHSQQVEDQLLILKKELEAHRSSGNVASAAVDLSTPAFITEHDVERRIKEALRAEQGKWQRVFEDEQRTREEQIQEKDRAIFEREQSLAEVEMRYRLLEERTLEANANGADLLSLSDQLQNEKATVSRAVAQNRELKAQLIETEDRLIALTDDKLQIELAKQAAEHQVRELTKQLNLEAAGLVTTSSTIGQKSSEDVVVELRQRSPDSYPTEDMDLSSSSENGADVEDGPLMAEDHDTEMDSPFEQENRELKRQLDSAICQLQEVRAELRRSNTQNEQMDQIMRQNAEDENQNSIHVELTQAVTRINSLASENQQLRDLLSEATERCENLQQTVVSYELSTSTPVPVVTEQPKGNDEAPATSTASEPEQDVVAVEPINSDEDQWARNELEKRFARAMMQNADLTESIDHLEHINQQLQLENDTIADHVILYQHQRRMIRERLKAKDDQLRAYETERNRMVDRCKELQEALMAVLNKSGVLKEYQMAQKSKKSKRRVSRSYSHSTVDELSGDEDVVVDAKNDVPIREKEANIADVGVHQRVVNEETSLEADAMEPPKSPPRNESPLSRSDQDATVRRILEIITDISSPNSMPAPNLHCTQCIGDIQEV